MLDHVNLPLCNAMNAKESEKGNCIFYGFRISITIKKYVLQRLLFKKRKWLLFGF